MKRQKQYWTVEKSRRLCFGLLIGQIVFGLVCFSALLLEKGAGTVWIVLLAVQVGLLVVNVQVMFWLYLKGIRKFKNRLRDFAANPLPEILIGSKNDINREWKMVMERWNVDKAQKEEIIAANKRAEHLALLNQIHPHFLYNVLESIRSDAMQAGLDSIAETTEALATFFRYTITEVGSLLPLLSEIDNVENYYKIQYYRFGDKLSLKINIKEDDPDILTYRIPKLTLQPIVENAIHHGLELKVEGGEIQIDIETTQNDLLISIRDNGVGICKERLDRLNDQLHANEIEIDQELSSHGGIALRNVNSRIKLIFGHEYGIHIYSKERYGTDVRMRLPITRSKGDGC